MPHDCKGRVVSPGDVVLVPFRVINVTQGEDYCNLTLETCATMPPDHKSQTTLSQINAAQVIRALKGDDTSFEVFRSNNGTLIRHPKED